jgi:hypothetical protein
MPDLQRLVSHQTIRDSIPKNLPTRDESKLGGQARRVIAKRLIRQGIKLASSDVHFELPVPLCGVKLHEPGTEKSPLFRRHLLNFRLDFFNPAHGNIACTQYKAPNPDSLPEAHLAHRRAPHLGQVIPARPVLPRRLGSPPPPRAQFAAR